MDDDARTLHALRTLHAVATAANAVVGAQPPKEEDLRVLADALTDYEATDAYDFVTDRLFPNA